MVVGSNRNCVISHNDIIRTVRKLFRGPILRELRERNMVLLLAILWKRCLLCICRFAANAPLLVIPDRPYLYSFASLVMLLLTDHPPNVHLHLVVYLQRGKVKEHVSGSCCILNQRRLSYATCVDRSRSSTA